MINNQLVLLANYKFVKYLFPQEGKNVVGRVK
jgi:hypothetical protein